MATANFQARIQRIEKAQVHAPQQEAGGFRVRGPAGVQAAKRTKRARPVALDHVMTVLIGLVLGCAVAVALLGLTLDTSPWGPGTEWHGLVYYPTIALLALAPLLMLVSLFTASNRPGFALYSLAYLSGIIIPLVL